MVLPIGIPSAFITLRKLMPAATTRTFDFARSGSRALGFVQGEIGEDTRRFDLQLIGDHTTIRRNGIL